MSRVPPYDGDEPRGLLTVEPFSLLGAGGGPRIMRSLLKGAPAKILAVDTSPKHDVEAADFDGLAEIHVPCRPSFGRLDNTRASGALGGIELILLRQLTRRVGRVVDGLHPGPRAGVVCLHAVPHSLDFVAVQRVASRLRLPMFLSLHDDPGWALQGRPERGYALRRLGEAWRSANARFVICEEMGIEMCRRYGERAYVTVSDGLETIALAPRSRVIGRMSVYFMGAAHVPYADNFQCLLYALSQLREEGVDARLIVRTGHLPFLLDSAGVPIEFRSWGTAHEVERDLGDVDVAYMPLPFGSQHREFVRFSMSTKMVTYLGSGVPLLFHGPKMSAARNLLSQADAALVTDALDVRALVDALSFSQDRGVAIVANALRLARHRFRLTDMRERFWQPILAVGSLPNPDTRRG